MSKHLPPKGTIELLTPDQLWARLDERGTPLLGDIDGDVAWVAEDLEIFGNLDLDETVHIPGWEGPTRPLSGLWVEGALHVHGAIANPCGDYGRFLVVCGPTRAEHVIGGGSEIYLEGGAEVQGLVLGHYNHGRLHIEGQLAAKVVVNDDHDLAVPSPSDALVVNDDPFDPTSFGMADYIDIFRPEFLELEASDEEEEEAEEGEAYLRLDTLIEALIDGRDVLKSPLPAQSRRWREAFRPDEGRSDGLVADLEGSYFDEIPSVILENPDLTALDLTGNRFTEVPEALARMHRLQVLDLSGNPLERLPDRPIHPDLHTLLLYEQKTLSLDDVVRFAQRQPELRNLGFQPKRQVALKDSIGELETIQGELGKLLDPLGGKPTFLSRLRLLFSGKARAEWRASMQQFTRFVGARSSYPRSERPAHPLPEGLGGLEQLWLHDVPLASVDLPEGATRLRSLSLAGSVHGLETAPDWTRFPALRSLDLSLHRRWTAEAANLPLLHSVAALPTELLELTLDHWTSLDPAVLREVRALPQLLERLTGLKRLSLIRTPVDVDGLIWVVAKMPDLELVDVEGITMSRLQRRRLASSCPEACEILD